MNRPKNKVIRIAILTMAIMLCFAMATVSAFAYDMTTDLYLVDVVVHENNTYDITEKISVDFLEYKHGLYRYIPIGNYKDMGNMKINDIDVPDWNYETYSEDGNMVIKIGDADEVLLREQQYNIYYQMEIYEDRDENRDFLYLDVIPTGWETPIEKASVSIKFPKKIDTKDIEVYIGGYGATKTDDTHWGYNKEDNSFTLYASHLDLGEGITVFCELPEGYWQGEAGYGWAKVTTIVLGILLPVMIILLWFLFGRDKKIIPTVEFYPPEGMTPAEVGFVMDNTVDKKDLLSLIFYFADKGYISIEEVDKKGIFDKKDFIITKLKEIDGNEKNFARTLFIGLFRKGDSINIDDLDEEFGDNYLTAYEQLNGHYFKKKNRQMSLMSGVLQILGLVFFVAVEVIVLVLAQWYSGMILPTVFATVGIIVSLITLLVTIVRADKVHTMSKKNRVVGGAVITIIQAVSVGLYSYVVGTMIEALWFTVILFVLLFGASIAVSQMRQRTKQSIELMGKLLGLKNFIEAAEVDRINMLIEENPSYFYNVLPYAYVMGLTDKWAKNFENINIERPTWYVGTNDTDMFDVWMMSRMMNSCSRSISNNIKFTVSDDSGSGGGGFGGGGGGFSGGGFGGGGGGSW
ncbi:MAG: DUF2207 domain-containing protein [Firmicutes bacterium]|nr:DUF2207 domain-containing protein [Bacillota bacterium]